MLFFIGGHTRVDVNAGGDGEAADVVFNPFGCYEIGQRKIGAAGGFFRLLTQAVIGHRDLAARFVAIDFDIVAHTVRGKQTDYTVGGEPLLRDDTGQHALGVLIELAGFDPDHFIFENFRKLAVQFPGREKRRPVNALGDFIQGIFSQGFYAQEIGRGRAIRRPVSFQRIGTRLYQRQLLDVGLLVFVALAHLGIVLAHFARIFVAQFR